MPPTSCLLPACFHKCKARPHSVNSVYTGRTGWKPKLYIRHQPYLQSAEYGLSDLANSKSSTERVNTVQTIGFGRPELGFFCVFVRILCTSAYWDNSNLSTKKSSILQNAASATSVGSLCLLDLWSHIWLGGFTAVVGTAVSHPCGHPRNRKQENSIEVQHLYKAVSHTMHVAEAGLLSIELESSPLLPHFLASCLL